MSVAQVNEVAHVHLLEGSEHRGGVLGILLQALGDPLASSRVLRCASLLEQEHHGVDGGQAGQYRCLAKTTAQFTSLFTSLIFRHFSSFAPNMIAVSQSNSFVKGTRDSRCVPIHNDSRGRTTYIAKLRFQYASHLAVHCEGTLVNNKNTYFTH